MAVKWSCPFRPKWTQTVSSHHTAIHLSILDGAQQKTRIWVDKSGEIKKRESRIDRPDLGVVIRAGELAVNKEGWVFNISVKWRNGSENHLNAPPYYPAHFALYRTKTPTATTRTAASP